MSDRELLSLLGDGDATVAIDADPADPRPVSRRELRQRSLRLRAELERAGVGRGDCVAVWLPNWSETLAWQFAAAAAGAHVIGVNTRYNVDEVTHVLDRARPAVVAVAHGFHGLDLGERLHRAVDAAEAPIPSVAVVTGPGQPPAEYPGGYDVGAGSWVPTTTAGSADAPVAADVTDELAVAFTTSGSTGKPKLAAHRQAAVTSHARHDAAAIGIRDGDVVLCALPLSGVFGFSTAMAAIAGGGVCLLEPVFDDAAVAHDMARHGVTHVVGADDLVGRLAGAWRREPVDLSSWRWLGIADFVGRVPELAQWALDEFGTVTAGIYGSSEVFALAAFWPHDEPAPRRWTGGGRVVSPEYRVRVIDPESDEPVPGGERGELQMRGSHVVDAYLGSPEAAQEMQARSFTADGWFRTGDLGELHPDGSFSYVCRMGDVLRLRGFLVEPAEIEFRLAAHEAVETAKVVGVRDASGAMQAIAFMVPRPGRSPQPDELRAWCAEVLAGFKVPAAVHVIDAMPTTSGTNGIKIRTAALREMAADRMADVSAR